MKRSSLQIDVLYSELSLLNLFGWPYVGIIKHFTVVINPVEYSASVFYIILKTRAYKHTSLLRQEIDYNHKRVSAFCPSIFIRGVS